MHIFQVLFLKEKILIAHTHTHTACGENGLFAVGRMYLKLKQFSSQVGSSANML